MYQKKLKIITAALCMLAFANISYAQDVDTPAPSLIEAEQNTDTPAPIIEAEQDENAPLFSPADQDTDIPAFSPVEAEQDANVPEPNTIIYGVEPNYLESEGFYLEDDDQTYAPAELNQNSNTEQEAQLLQTINEIDSNNSPTSPPAPQPKAETPKSSSDKVAYANLRLDFPQGVGMEVGWVGASWLDIFAGINYLPLWFNLSGDDNLAIQLFMVDLGINIHLGNQLTLTLGGVYNGNRALTGSNITAFSLRSDAKSIFWYPQKFGPYVGISKKAGAKTSPWFFNYALKVYWLGPLAVAAGGKANIISEAVRLEFLRTSGDLLKLAQFWVNISFEFGVYF